MQKHTFFSPKSLFWATLFALGMACAALWDLPLNVQLYAPQSFPAIFMEGFGIAPLYFPCVLWAACLSRCFSLQGRKAASGVLFLISCLGLGALLWYGGHILQRREIPAAWGISTAIWLFLALCSFALLRRARAALPRLEYALRWATVFMVGNNVLITPLKLLWNRTRFDDMALSGGDFSAFTPWFHLPGNGGTSFPSGHTAAACGIFVLLLLCDTLPRFAAHRTLLQVICAGYIALVAVSRLVMGRHYLSDTLMAVFVMVLLFGALTRCELYRQGLAALETPPRALL